MITEDDGMLYAETVNDLRDLIVQADAQADAEGLAGFCVNCVNLNRNPEDGRWHACGFIIDDVFYNNGILLAHLEINKNKIATLAAKARLAK